MSNGKNTYLISTTWLMEGSIEIEAQSEEEAKTVLFNNAGKFQELLNGGEFVKGSIEEMSIEEL